MSPIPRVARAPLTSKQPDACPHCGGHNVSRRGTRTKKLEIVQLWRCASCKRVFTPGPGALHNKTYPLRMIVSAEKIVRTGYRDAVEEVRERREARGGGITGDTLVVQHTGSQQFQFGPVVCEGVDLAVVELDRADGLFRAEARESGRAQPHIRAMLPILVQPVGDGGARDGAVRFPFEACRGLMQ